MVDPELLQYMKETAAELRELRGMVLKLQQELRDKSIKSRFLTMDEACEYMKISRATMAKRLSSGEICFATKRGKSWLFPEEKLRAYASGMA